MNSGDSSTAPTDEELAAGARLRESPARLRAAQEACRELYGRHTRPLLAFLATRVPRADLEDVHHEVWVRVWQHLPGHFDGTHFRGWLFRIARNCLLDRMRRRRTLGVLADDRPDPRSPLPDAELEVQERRQALERCLKRLDGVQADLVRGRLGGEDYLALCTRLDLTPERAHKLFHTAKRQLHDCVQQAGA